MKAESPTSDTSTLLEFMFRLGQAYLASGEQTALVELFPTRIRYTALSFPYHLGIGWFGGLLPTIAFSLVVATGNIYSGLWYAVVVGVISFLIAALFYKEVRGRHLDA